jgi:Ca2+/Na+ antiporter
MLTLTGFYTAFSPACFSLLGLWLVVIQLKPGAWINRSRKKQAYAVTLFFAAPGTMSLLALIDPMSTVMWRVVFLIVSVLGVVGMIASGSPHHRQHHDAFDVSDHVVYWLAIGVYVAIAVLAIPSLNALRIEGVLLTVLMLLGVLLALMLMFAVGDPDPKAEPAANPPPAG